MSPNTFILVIATTLMSIIFAAAATVPPARQFKYVNEGDFGEYLVEYSANYRVLDLQTFPFALCFYNSTPDAFILGIRMGHRRSESIMRWVWDANRGTPVRENATLMFGRDGNLVLADADGKIAWQTNTANKGVTGLSLLGNGNLVLYNARGGYVWQSFDHPTDTLLVGQSLSLPPSKAGPNRLVSRLSRTEAIDGPYSFLMEESNWAMYYEAKNSKTPFLYYKSFDFGNGDNSSQPRNITFFSEPTDDRSLASDLGFTYAFSSIILARPKYNSTYTMLRVDVDGNLRAYTYDPNVDWGAWEVTYVLFDRDEGEASECRLPRRCGNLGVCYDKSEQCVACPTAKGLLGWSEGCQTPKVPPCKGGAGGGKVDYYRVDGVEHYSGRYSEGDGPVSLAQCRDKCSNDCTCLGFFYRAESSKCLVVPEIGTLVKVVVSNSSRAGYIKFAK